MSARYPSGRPSNMGQENSTLAQQSLNISAGGSRATSINEMRSSDINSNATKNYGTGSTQRGRSRSPGRRSTINYPLPPKPPAQSLDTRMRPRSPPPTTGRSTGRIHSPGSVRHKFVREDDEERRHMYDARSRSPNARFGTRDNAPYRSSPESRRPSNNFQNWSRNASLSTTPREPLAQRLNVPTTERTRSVGGTIDYHGLRDVPTGPRPKASDLVASSPPRSRKTDFVARSPSRSKKRDFVTRSPCIFISFKDLPNLPSLGTHLDKMLGRKRNPHFVDLDDYGWNLVYANSPTGLERLTRCFEKYNDQLLFSQYKLRMQCYPNGKQPRPQDDMEVHSSGGVSGSSASQVPQERPNSAVMPGATGFEARQLNHPKPIESLKSKVDTAPLSPEKADALAHTPIHALPVSLFGHSYDSTRIHEPLPMGRSTSMLSLRSDRDETGSLGSGVTRSDGTRIKRDRCYRCNGESVPGSSLLVRCSTCTRQYHRRCHQDFPIPANLTETTAWSCASCIKKEKERTGKDQSKENKEKTLSKPEEIVPKAQSVPEDPPDRSLNEMPDCCGPIAMNTNEASNTQLQLLRSDSKSPQHETRPQADLTTNSKPATADERDTLSDADDLVAKSFAAAEVQSHSTPHSQKPGKLKITRTKLPPKPLITTTQQTRGENRLDLNGSSTKPPVATLSNTSVKAFGMNGAVGRGTAADLRALAHERHQTAIKNGAEGHFVSEEERLRHNASGNTPRLSPAHQSPSESAEPQKPSTMVPPSSASALARHVTERNEREIPESPDEVRRSEAISSKDPIVNPRTLAFMQPTETAAVPPRQIPDVAPLQDEKSPAVMRPRASYAVVRCQNCQKQIPRGPTGMNKLCSGCKRDAAAAVDSNAYVDAKANPQTSITPLQTSFAPVANMGHSPQTNAASAEQGPQGNQVIETNQQEQRPSVTSDGSRQAACDSCRKRNADCTHNDPVAQASAPLECDQQGNYATGSGKPTIETTAGKVIEASLAQNAEHSAPDQDVVRNPLVAKILGELQFAPTVQSQLREEPSMAESKLVLLKQILDENDDAKTDVLALATKLAEAQRLSFIKSVVGDSSDRPKGSRLILVAMALGSTASRRMQAKDVMDWIADTIPGYKKGEGNWASRISAMLSQGRLITSGTGYGGYSGCWREDEWQEGDGGKPKAKWYQLLPEKEDEMWTWCPVLKEPLSPSARREAQKAGKSAVRNAPVMAQAPAVASTSGPVTPKSSTNEAVSIYCGSFVQEEDGKRLNAAGAEAVGGDAMEIDGLEGDGAPQSLRGLKRKHSLRSKVAKVSTLDQKNSSSSEDEPLSASWKIKRRRGETLLQARTQSPATQQQTPTNRGSQDEMELEHGMSTVTSAERGDAAHNAKDSASKASNTSVGRRKSGLVILRLNGSRRPSTAESHDCSFAAKREQLAASLYEEWPEFRQHTDEHDKLAEIQKRPRKKKLFGKLASHPQVRFETDLSTQTFVTTNLSPEKRSRTRMVDPRPDEPYPWENPDNDPTRKEYTSLEEFFDFPDNMIPIISEGQLAYRDGTRTDDGRLPRAREIFKL